MASSTSVHEEDEYDCNDEFIASFVWDRGHLASSYFHKNSMELYVTQETADLRPDFRFLHNLHRQINIKETIASGPSVFLKCLMTLAHMPPDDDPKSYKINFKNPITTSSFIVYPNDEKSLLSNRHRIYNLQLPGMNDGINEFDRKIFLETLLPIHSELVVQSLGNLIHYLEANWRHLFLMDDPNLMISNISVFSLDSHVLMDDSTFLALQIFSPAEHHPASSKRGTTASTKEGFSLYSMFNRCYSKIGKNELKIMLNQPIRDLDELTIRHTIIEWCLKNANQVIIKMIENNLAQINNIGEIFLALCASSAKMTEWQKLRQSTWNIFTVCRILSERNDQNAFLKDFSDAVHQRTTLKNVITLIDKIIDMEESVKAKRFITKFGQDEELDREKEKYEQMKKSLETTVQNEISNLPENVVGNISLQYFQETGFVLGIQRAENGNMFETINIFERHAFRFLFENNNELYFKTMKAEQLNNNLNCLYGEICTWEQGICNRLLQHLRNFVPELQELTRLCAKLDCLIAMAKVANEMNLIRPEMCTEKIIEIKSGRHILLEFSQSITPNDTKISVADDNLTTILSAPNACGKSVYLKQIGLIAYLTHIGSFVPAKHVKICLLESIYTRIYSPETIHYDTSTFLLELQQLGKVLCNSSSRSLVLIDEFGKGTNVLEGKAILCAALDDIIARDDLAPINIISTHYADLIDMLNNKKGVCLKTIEIRQQPDDTIQSTFKIIDGRNIERYAMNCAKTKPILDEIFKSPNGSAADDSMAINDDFYKEKIKFAMTLVQEKIKNGFVDFSKAKQMFDNLKLN